jgi:error-prone DNA polymerase
MAGGPITAILPIADAIKHGGGPDHRDPAEKAIGRAPRDIYIPDLRLGSGIRSGQPTEGIKVKARNFY